MDVPLSWEDYKRVPEYQVSWGSYLTGSAYLSQCEIWSNSGKRFIVRYATKGDSSSICNVCLRTGNAGEDASQLYKDNPMILGERWVLPYVYLEPSLAFVLVDTMNDEIVGYALGCLHTRLFEKRLEDEYLPLMRRKHPNPTGSKLSPDDEIRKEFYDFQAVPDCVVASGIFQYPSHLHIDIVPRCQGDGLGRTFLSVLLASLRLQGSVGVHLEMSGANERASRFYERLGFREIAVVDASNKSIVHHAAGWKFVPSSFGKKGKGADVVVYFGMNLKCGEDSSLATDWNPLSKVIAGDNIIRKALSNFSELGICMKNGDDSFVLASPLVCTAPEPWAIVKHIFDEMTLSNSLNDSKSSCKMLFNKIHGPHIIDSMDESKLRDHGEKFLQMRNGDPNADIPHITCVIGIGGGSACDTAKYFSNFLNLPLVLIPSILSVDAAFTRAAGVRHIDASGKTSVRYVGDVSSRLSGLIVDYNLLHAAPLDLNRAGIGDILSILTALWDWREAHRRQGESLDSSIYQHARVVLNRLAERGSKYSSPSSSDDSLASSSCLAQCSSEGLNILVECFCDEVKLCERWGNSRPEEGSEHYLAYCIESRTGRAYIHGKLIGLCTTIVTLLQYFALPHDRSKLYLLHRDLLRKGDDSATDWEDNAIKVLNECHNAKVLTEFLKSSCLDCQFGPDNGNPSVDEVFYSLLSMEEFVKNEHQLLPGYFHFFGSPSEQLSRAVVKVSCDLLSNCKKS